MCIVDHQREIIRYFDKFDPAFDMCLQKCFLHLICRDTKVIADRDRTKCIVNTESARCMQLDIQIYLSSCLKINAQKSCAADQLQILCTVVCILCKAECFDLACMIPDHILIMGIVTVDDTDSALLEQQSLAMHIISKILMLQRSDMIRLDIGKNTKIKQDTGRSVQHQSL